MKKLIYFLSLVSVQVSSGLAQGLEYTDSVNKTVNPESLEHVGVLYQFLGAEVAVTVFAPIVVALVFGWKTGLWNKDKFWLVMTGIVLTAVVAVPLFPFLLML